ncbi:MAG: four helix bundle protein [Clostridia bacterium]|nr:four helix bundle protein [Clostridia bacterium]
MEQQINNIRPSNSMQEANTKQELKLIPKAETYIQYMLDLILKLPKTERYSIGTEYKSSMYQMLENIMYISKIDSSERLPIINKIDAELNTQRIFLRIMTKNRWMDQHKCKVSMDLIYEIGKIVGGLVKYYGKNYKK